MIFDPELNVATVFGCDVISDLECFKEESDLIVANRIEKNIIDVLGRVYMRDIFNGDV